MIDGKPDYTRLSTLAMADIVMLGESDRLIFVNALCEMFENMGKAEFKPEERSGFVGRAIARQFAEFRKGINVYMANATRNLSGTKPTPEGNPVGNPVGIPEGNPAVTPTRTRTRTEQEREREPEQEPEQSKSVLSAEEYRKLTSTGYSDAEISAAEASVEDWSKVRNKPRYIVGIIAKMRKQRTVTAQEYTQREYDEPEESPEEMLARLKEEMGNE